MSLFDKIRSQAESLIEKRGGMDSLKEDLAELKDIATSHGSLKDKAGQAVAALKDPGTEGEPAAPAASAAPSGAPAAQAEAPAPEPASAPDQPQPAG